jgi:hypothetical protein
MEELENRGPAEVTQTRRGEITWLRISKMMVASCDGL